MPVPRDRRSILNMFERSIQDRRMRWSFMFFVKNKKALLDLVEDLAPLGYRRRKYKYYRSEKSHAVILEKLAHFDRDQLVKEVRKLHAACDHLGEFEFDLYDAEEIDPLDRLRN